MKHLSCIALILSLFHFSALSLSAQGDTKSVSKSISSYRVNSIAEDGQGYIWFGTNYGINRYGGSDYVVYHAGSDSLAIKDDFIGPMATDGRGRVWVSTRTGFGVWEGGVCRYFSASFPSSRIVPMGGRMFLFSNLGVVRINADTFAEEGCLVGEDVRDVNGVVKAGDDRLWLLTEGKGGCKVLVMDSDLTILGSLDLPVGAAVSGFMADAEGLVWILSDGGLFTCSPDGLSPQAAPEALQALVRSGDVKVMIGYAPGTVLFGIGGRGLFVYDKGEGSLSRVFPEETLPESRYNCFVDSMLGLWLCDNVSAPRRRPYSTACDNISSPLLDAMDDPVVRKVVVDAEGMLWLISGKDLVCYDADRQEILSHHRSTNYQYLVKASDSCLWLSSTEGVSRLAVGGGRQRTLSSYAPGGIVISIAEAADGSVWLSHNDGAILKIDAGGETTSVKLPRGVTFSGLLQVRGSREICINTLESGVWLCAEDGGMRRLEIPATTVSAMLRDVDGSYWIGTPYAGLLHYDPQTGSVEGFDNGNDSADNYIKDICMDSMGNVWYCTPSEVHRHDKGTGLVATVRDAHYRTGLNYSDRCSAVSGDGRTLYFCGSGGITVIRADEFPTGGFQTPLWLDFALVDGVERDLSDGGLVLGPRDKGVDFRWSAIDFESGQSVTYASCLEGFDAGWMEGVDRKQASYTNLSRGRYVFRVKVRNPDGSWSANELGVAVRVRPPLLLCNAALVLWGLLLLGLVAAYIVLIMNNNLQKERLREAEKNISMGRSPASSGVVGGQGMDGGRLPETGGRLAEIYEAAARNLSDEDFGVQELARKVGMSYSSLYQWLKVNADDTPQAIIKRMRMEKALELLKQGRSNVSEVCFAVGFSSLSNFSKSFKAQFGILPSQVRK